MLAGALVKPRPMMWYKTWREMLHGVLLEMSLVERRGGKDGLVVGISSCSSSGSKMGIAYVVGLVLAGLLCWFGMQVVDGDMWCCVCRDLSGWWADQHPRWWRCGWSACLVSREMACRLVNKQARRTGCRLAYKLARRSFTGLACK